MHGRAGYGFVVSLFSIGCTIFFASVLINKVKTFPKQDMVLQELRRGDLQFDIFIFLEKGIYLC